MQPRGRSRHGVPSRFGGDPAQAAQKNRLGRDKVYNIIPCQGRVVEYKINVSTMFGSQLELQEHQACC